MTTEIYNSNQHGESEWCQDCQGYGHAPRCSHYVEKVAPEGEIGAENVSEGPQEGKESTSGCCERCDESERQEQNAAQIDHAVAANILTAIKQDDHYASLTTAATAIYDVIDTGDYDGSSWLLFLNESQLQSATRERFVEAVKRRITQLQQPPHCMDRRLYALLRGVENALR